MCILQEDTAVDEPEHESQKESKSLWTKASHKMLKLTGLRKRTDSTNLEVEDIWPAHYTQLLDPPAVLSILGHWDRKVRDTRRLPRDRLKRSVGSAFRRPRRPST